MVTYQKKILDNGLVAIVHEDRHTPLVAFNIIYNVGSKNEKENMTGMTHLFEHLMFSGTKNVRDFDEPIQNAGGENNAFTNNDFTNFYTVLPAENIEIALWLEADRMQNMHFTKTALNTQKKVVIEEFKETCLNEPYGDMFHHISAMAYPRHHYRWPTIGLEIDHIKKVHIDDVHDFFHRYYQPSNAIIVLAGNIKADEAFMLLEKWFGGIQGRPVAFDDVGTATLHNGYQQKIVEAKVPANGLVMAFNMADRKDHSFYEVDLLSDILSSGRSSRLFANLVKDRQLFSSIDAFVTGTIDPGLLMIDGRMMDDVPIEQGKAAIWEILYDLKSTPMEERELQKIKNKAESNLLFSEISVLSKAMSLGFYESFGAIDLINDEVEKYLSLSADDLHRAAKDVFTLDNCAELQYHKI